LRDTTFWLQLNERHKSAGNDLYTSIKDINLWIERNAKLNMGDQIRLYSSLLVEVNSLDIAVNKRLQLLQHLHQPIMAIIDNLSKKYMGCALPIAQEKSKYVQYVELFWTEMATAYKIIVDDLSATSVLNFFIANKDLSNALYHVMFYLQGQVYSNYLLYTACTDKLWRDIHQVYHFAEKRKQHKKKINANEISEVATIAQLYKKILLFSLANPYQLTLTEMQSLWQYLTDLADFAQLELNSKKVLKGHYPFFIRPYSDQPPYSNFHQNNKPLSESNLLANVSANTIWGIETKKLLKRLTKKNTLKQASAFFVRRLSRNWASDNARIDSRIELIEPVVLAMGVTCISQFLTQIDIEPKILKLDESQQLQLTQPSYLLYQAYLIDESSNGFKLKLKAQSEKSILPSIGEVIAIKHFDESIHIGYLRWMKENRNADVEFGIEYLSAMAEAVQISKSKFKTQQKKAAPDVKNILDSFVFPGNKEQNYKPILFTHSFVENFYNIKEDTLSLTHKTGSIEIKLVEKIDQVLSYSLYLFEKSDT